MPSQVGFSFSRYYQRTHSHFDHSLLNERITDLMRHNFLLSDVFFEFPERIEFIACENFLHFCTPSVISGEHWYSVIVGHIVKHEI
jgi:hypothetical protein